MTARLVAGPDPGNTSARIAVPTAFQINNMHHPKYDATSSTAVLRFPKEES